MKKRREREKKKEEEKKSNRRKKEPRNIFFTYTFLPLLLIFSGRICCWSCRA
jgi:hypothetical protein